MRQTKRSNRKSTAEVYRKTVLPNGVRVLSERHPTSRAVSCGVWICGGTRDESEGEGGLAHFLEHLVFKRTQRRSAYQIARDMEAVGGDLNAFTSREATCFLTHTLKDDLGLSIDVLSDLVCRPQLHATDIKKEKQVVLQEIRMSADQLEDCIYDHFLDRVYPKSTLGRPILGTSESIGSLKRKSISDFYQREYVAERTIVTVTGNVAHHKLLEQVHRCMKFPPGRRVRSGIRRQNEEGLVSPKFHSFCDVIRRPSEQVHLLVGFPSVSIRDERRFDASIVNALLGGGMTSRLYQKVREERGLVYSIESQLMTFTDAGLNLIYAASEPKNSPTVLELIIKELKRLKKVGVGREELKLYKKQVLGQVLLGADDIENRMNALGVNEMIFGQYRSVEKIMKDIDAVTIETLHDYLERVFAHGELGILVMGPLPQKETCQWMQSL